MSASGASSGSRLLVTSQFRLWALALTASAATVTMSLVPSPLLQEAAKWWVVSEPLASADAALVLGGGFDRRPHAAADLFRRGLIKQVLVAQVKPSSGGDGESESLRSRAALIESGVPAAAILPFGDNVQSTYDEALAAVIWASAAGVSRVIVPTDWHHTRRVRWVFGRTFAETGVEFTVVALPQNPESKASRQADLQAFAREAIKYFYYRVRYAFVARPNFPLGKLISD